MADTLFDLEMDAEDLPVALDAAARAARLTRLVVAGLLVDAEHNVIEPEDVRLIQECAEMADVRAWQARKLFSEQQQPRARDRVDPDNVIDLMEALKRSLERQKGEPA